MSTNLALLSGLLLALSMPGPDLGGLAWIALVPLFWALRGAGPRQGFRLGWLAGFAYFGTLLYWIYALWDWASLAILPGYLLLVGYLALYWGAFGALYRYLSGRLPPWALVSMAPALWVTLEYMRGLTRFGFPWGQAADAAYGQLPVIQLASITGIWGVSFLIVLVNVALYVGLRSRDARYPALALLLAGAIALWGWTQLERPLPDGRDLRVAIVQPNIPQRIRNDPRRLEEFSNIYQTLLAGISAEGESVELTILPESILPTFVLEDERVRGPLTSWAQANDSTLLFGTYRREPGDARVYNSAALLSPSGTTVGTYDKIQLVPFSTEYFPGIALLDQLGVTQWLPIGRLGALTPGTDFEPLKSPLGAIATPICFESIFSRISRAFVLRGAELIVTVTNDAWFKDTWALPQHFVKGVYRAVETGRYFVQAANTGISGIIDPQGRIVARTQIEERTALLGAVRLLHERTLYTRYGDWFVYFLGLIVGLIVLGVARPGSRRTPRRTSTG